MTRNDLRRYAIARSLFAPTTLTRALERLGFVQADPIRAPARAQDLTLRHRVRDYRAGDLERRYPRLALEEDFFVNYGFLPRAQRALMHPRTARTPWDAATGRRARAVLAFVRERGAVHPSTVDDHFAHGRVTNNWGGASVSTTHLLDTMHYRGLLRVVRRENGVRVYASDSPPPRPAAAAARERLDALVDLIVGKYAPLPERSLNELVRRLRYGTPQWTSRLDAALARARRRLNRGRVDGVEWFWPQDEAIDADPPVRDEARLLAPFD